MLNRLYLILLSSGLIFATPIIKNIHQNKKIKKEEEKKFIFYSVKSGDTLFSIAKKFKVSLGEIQKANKLSSLTLIHPGDKLKIPNKNFIEEAKKAVKENKKTVYKIKRGDTLYSIARKFHMKLDDLIKLNKLHKNKLLTPGEEINVYAPKEVLQKRKVVTKHIVSKGETLWSIAKKYNLSVRDLKILNPKVRYKRLKAGMILSVSKKRLEKLKKMAKLRKKRLNGMLAKYRIKYRNDSGNQRVVRYAKRFLGRPYVWGASNGYAFDCSGFTQYVFKHAKGKVIPRISRRQAYYGMYVPRSRLIGGDLVFFDTHTPRRGYVNHVGIYIGRNYFIHASSAKHRVVITSLNKPFYSHRFMWGRRIN